MHHKFKVQKIYNYFLYLFYNLHILTLIITNLHLGKWRVNCINDFEKMIHFLRRNLMKLCSFKFLGFSVFLVVFGTEI